MGARRALIVGSDKDYCYVIKEFLESRGLIVSLILDYNQGIDKLFYENPDISILELISSHRISTNLLGKVRSSLDLQVIDNFSNSDIEYEEDKKHVFLLEDTSQLNTLLAYLNTFLINNYYQAKRGKADSATEDKHNNLKSYPYPILLSYIYRNNISCVLDISSTVKLRIYFEKGLPVFAEGGEIETALGRMLLERGNIRDEAEYDKILAKANEKGQKLGEVLVSMELISPHELNDVLQKQVKEKLIRGFDLKEGNIELSQEDNFLSQIVRYDIAFPQLIHEGIKRYSRPDLLKNIFYSGDLARKLNLDKSIHQKSQNIGLGPKDLRIIQDLEKNADLEKLIKNSTAGKDEVLKLLLLIYLLGMLKVENGPYSGIDKVFSNITWDKLNNTSDVVEEIIDLEEEIPEDIRESATKDTTRASSFKLLDDVSVKDQKTEMSDISASEKSNVITFKDQLYIKEDSEPGYHEAENEPVEEKTDKEFGRGNIYKRELIKSFHDFFDEIEEKTHYQILGVSKDSSQKEIKDAYYFMVKKYHPDVLSSIDSEISEKADHVFAKIIVAYQTLIDETMRSQYDATFEFKNLKSQAGVLYKAEIEHNEGLALLKQKNYDQAIQRFSKAKEINPDNMSYSSLISWANFLKDRDNRDIINKAISVFEKAINRDPTSPDNYYYLGCVYKHIDELRKAEANFSKAVEHDPDFVEAKRELRVIKNRKVENKDTRNIKTEKRFWSGIFKK